MLSRLKKLSRLFDRSEKARLAGLLCLMVLGSLAEVAGIGAIPAFVALFTMSDQVMQNPAAIPVLQALNIETDRELVVWGSLGLMLVFTLKNVYLGFVYYVQARTAERYRVLLADRLFRAYLHAPYEFHLNRNSAELLRNVNHETREILISVLNPLLTAAMAILMTVAVIVFVLVATPSYAVAGIVVVSGGSWLFVRIFKKQLRISGTEAQQERRASIQCVNQALGSIIDTKVLSREGYFIESFRESLATGARANRVKETVGKLSTPFLELVAIAGMVLIMLLMTVAAGDLETLVPTLALFGAVIVRLRATVSSAVTAITQIRYGSFAIDPVVDDLRALETTHEYRKARFSTAALHEQRDEPADFVNSIQLADVEFAYGGYGIPAVQGISITIPKGSSVAFVGSTGSGKSTLIALLLALLKPTRGSISVDGRNIHADPDMWHRCIGYVPQQIYILDDTIRNNIAFGLLPDSIEEHQVLAALIAAQLDEFVASLPDGLDTVVGERGVRLSGGQRQRIGLARALYNRPQVLFLDEATSALDGITEEAVMQAIQAMGEEMTVVLVAHRLATVKDCDRIFMLEGGRIVAEGTYDTLVAENTQFRSMAKVAPLSLET